jgi:hypothetical protein
MLETTQAIPSNAEVHGEDLSKDVLEACCEVQGPKHVQHWVHE